ncbi:hypothetical protein NPX13_g10671 [Xylaria arbuscula]|uniref:Uncharacterized protein n=1 Tax=Xylaria arbuscula TaxID=114810 RepID=A0A9W8TGD4_9PEZI|nr:hypothetical protein NPX13_g10671 [Xylaria arbuscula]
MDRSQEDYFHLVAVINLKNPHDTQSRDCLRLCGRADEQYPIPSKFKVQDWELGEMGERYLLFYGKQVVPQPYKTPPTPTPADLPLKRLYNSMLKDNGDMYLPREQRNTEDGIMKEFTPHVFQAHQVLPERPVADMRRKRVHQGLPEGTPKEPAANNRHNQARDGPPEGAPKGPKRWVEDQIRQQQRNRDRHMSRIPRK